MSFVPADILDKLEAKTQAQLDELTFGVVKLNDKGLVEAFNKYALDLGKGTVTNPIGENFFLKVAPCTNNKLFKGKFDQGIQNNELDSEFSYTFTYRIRPTNVAVRLYQDPKSKSNWIFLLKK